MARTSLMNALQRTLAKTWWARQQGLSSAAQRDELWTAWTMKRRQFLRHALQTAAWASLPLAGTGCSNTSDNDTEVVIVGAGIAGLHCAFRLQQAGVRTRVFDAWNRIGGRMFSARELFSPEQVAELGGEFIDSIHLCLLTLAEEFGLQIDDRFAEEPPGLRRETFYFEGRVVEEDDIIERFEPLAERMAAAVAAAESSDVVFDEVDAMSISEWLDLQDADPLIRSILEVAYIGEYGLEADAQTVFNLLCLIDFEEPDPLRIFGDSDERFHLHAGNDAIPTRLAEQLGSQIEIETRLIAVTELADRRFRLTFVREAGKLFEVIAEHVVLALPFSTLRQVALNVTLPDDKRRVIQELGYGTNAKLLGGFTTRVWREQLNASGSSFTDNGIQATWDTTIGQPGVAGILTNFLGGNAGLVVANGSAEARMLEALPRLDDIFPGTAAAFIPNSAVRMHWPSHPLFQGSYTCYRPGQTSFFGIEGRREGNLHFCGEHTSQDFQGFMEGAAETGARVAAEILYDLGLSTPAALDQLLRLTRRSTPTSARANQLRRLHRRRRPGFIRWR